MNVQFYCRPCKANKNGYAPVETSIIIAGKRAIVSLPRKEKPDEFSRNLTARRDNDTKRYCEAMRRNINAAVTSIAEAGEALTIDTLKQYLKTGGIKPFTVEDMFSMFMETQSKRIGTGLSKNQYRKYEITRDLFFKFVEKGLPASSITYATIEDFEASISNDYAKSTVSSILTKIKCVVEFAFKSGKIKSSPFAAFHIDKQKPREEWLTEEEIEKIRTIKIDSVPVSTSRDLFLFQCASGISYSDLSKLTEDDITEDNGVYSVSKTRTKTGIPYTSVILPEGVEILKKYNFKLPVISNQKYNLNLLKIQIMAGLDKHIHSHLGRKVYGSTLLRNGCPMKTVSRALGHSTTQVTESTYAFLRRDDIIKEISTKLSL